MAPAQGSVAGLVWYRQTPVGWEGRWSHVDLSGALASERVDGADLEKLPGKWPVQVMGPGGEISFSGELQATKLGDCIQLTWTGRMTAGAEAIYDGIGYRLNAGELAATFQARSLGVDAALTSNPPAAPR